MPCNSSTNYELITTDPLNATSLPGPHILVVGLLCQDYHRFHFPCGPGKAFATNDFFHVFACAGSSMFFLASASVTGSGPDLPSR